MATAVAKKYCTEIEIPEISKLDWIYSPEMLIHGIPWKVKFCKKGEDAEQRLAIYLHCANADKSPNWSLWGSASFKLLPFNDNANPIEYHFDPYVFDASGCSHGTHSLIKWNDLFNAEKKYVSDDTINLEVKITAQKPTDPNRSRLNFDSVQNSCENCHFAKFRLSVNNILNLAAVQTPDFTLYGIPWEIQVSKKRSSNLGIMFRLKNDAEKKHSKMTMIIKLVSSKKDAQPVEKCITKQYQYLWNVSVENVISWDELVKPENGFVNDNSITLEISISPSSDKSDLNDEPVAKRAKLNPENEAKSPQMECPICLKCITNQDLAVTTCGHMFCFECIKKSIETRPACPSCNEAVRLNGLRQIYLPGVN